VLHASSPALGGQRGVEHSMANKPSGQSLRESLQTFGSKNGSGSRSVGHGISGMFSLDLIIPQRYLNSNL
jgi:hypothetical protein